MHGHVSYEEFLHGIAGFLGSYYIVLAMMNGVAAFMLWQKPEQKTLFNIPGVNFPITASFGWLLVSLVFLLLAPLAYSGDPGVVQYITVPAAVRAFVNHRMSPTVYIVGTFVALLFLFLTRRFF